jgi:hypothetical protein
LMKRMFARCTAKPQRAEENERLIEGVFEELPAKSPDGLRYLALRPAGGAFVHFVATESADGAGPLRELGAFRSFQSGIEARCVESPLAGGATIVGNYRMRGE